MQIRCSDRQYSFNGVFLAVIVKQLCKSGWICQSYHRSDFLFTKHIYNEIQNAIYGTTVKLKFKTDPQINIGSTACHSNPSGQSDTTSNSRSESSSAVWKLSELHADKWSLCSSHWCLPLDSSISGAVLDKIRMSETEFSATFVALLSGFRSLASEGDHVV